LIGNTVSVDEVLREVNKDQVFYRTSGGGVTISGGEPLAQAAFVRELLQACRRYGINTAIETCGHAPWEDFASVLAHTDNILFDIKHLDANVHSRLTGVSNKLILENLRRAVASGMSVILRMPLVKGCTADAETVRGVAALAVELGIAELHLLPYHRLGESKYRALRREYPLQGVEPLADEEIKHLQEIAEDGTGLLISVGG
jgi:pyruvate formate lyase activating enzyme